MNWQSWLLGFVTGGFTVTWLGTLAQLRALVKRQGKDEPR